jgi:hypothetical protein
MHQLPRRSSKLSNFLEKGAQRCDSCAAIDTCYRLINVYETHHQPNVTSGETCQKIEDSVKPFGGTRCMKPSFHEGVRSLIDDQPIA